MLPDRHSGEDLLAEDTEAQGVTKRLARSGSQKSRKQNHRKEGNDEDTGKGFSLRCLNLYGRGFGCKVGAETGDESGDPNSRRSSTSEEGRGYRSVCGSEEINMDCFSYTRKDRSRKRSNGRDPEPENMQRHDKTNPSLPDDIIEMCLMRLPLTSLMNARLVCKKWRHLSTAPRFMQMRRESLYQTPWLFLFGAVKDGYCSGEIHAFDIALNRWHRLAVEFVKGRFLFSVAGFSDEIYIVGGCTSLSNYGKVDRSAFKTHKSVLVFSPASKTWHRAPPMKHSRSSPILGISEVSVDFSVVHSQQGQQERRILRSRLGGESEVYEDPHRLSVRRHMRNETDENEGGSMSLRKQNRYTRQKNDNINNCRDCRRFVLIVVGGHGSWDEPLDSGEIYDSASNKWIEIQKLPSDFGIVCSGVMCKGMFFVYSETDRLVGYDIARGYWVGIQTSPPPPRVHGYYPKMVSGSGRLFMLSVSWCESEGQIGRRNKAIRKLWELDLVDLTWAEVSTHPDAPMDWNALFVAEKGLLFGVEMFKIFGQVLDFFTVCDVSDSDKAISWRHISKNRVANDLDASSSMTKAMAVLYL